MASAPSFFSISLLLSFTLTAFAQQTSPIKPGATLTTANSSYWQSSPSGDFKLGFRQLSDATFLLSIFYSKIPDTVVWYAGADGVLAPKGSKLTSTADQGLVLTDPQGKSLWVSPISAGGKVSNFVLNDTGNLVIYGADGDTLWQSFDDPRDTLLPGQMIGNLSSGGPKIYSKQSKSNFTRGKFQLRMLDDGNLVLNTRSLVTDFAYDGAYYISGTRDAINISNSGYMVSYDFSGQMYIVKHDGELVDLLDSVPSPKEDYYFRATLNFDGVLAWYYHKKELTGNTSSWTVNIYQPDNICSDKTGTMDGGVCGFNSICKIGNNGDYAAPTCDCPPQYSLVDPNDPFGSCKPDFKLDYNDNIDYRFEKLSGIDWPFREYDQLSPITEDDCKTSCLNDFLCVAIILREQDSTCWKKAFPLINGRIDNSRTAFLKVSDGNNTPPPFLNVIKPWKGMNTLVSTFLGTSVFVNVLLGGVVLGICFCQRTRFQKVPRTVNSSISCFTYKELEEATNGFKEELGRGACAIVYKGAIDNSQTLIAVKKIDRLLLREADREFQTEVSIIGKTHHKNLVRLIGYCQEEDHRMLVYEYMRNGSLSDFLFTETKPSWFQRVQIGQGIARGLFYLHEECGNRIIHCDIKPQNVLLDDSYEARISDFGLSKLMMMNQFQTHTGLRGTKGYVAPEWFRNKPVTVKVDVYSFGVVLLEILSCRRCIDMEASEEKRVVLMDWAFECYEFGDLSGFVGNESEALDDKMRLENFLKVALWCVQEDPNLRPTMKKVTLMLEDVIDVPAPPLLNDDSYSVSIVNEC